MKLSFSTNGFVEYSVFEAIERIADIGYEGVELLADAPHLYADSLSTRDLEKLKGAIDRTGLKVANINANTAMGCTAEISGNLFLNRLSPILIENCDIGG